MLGDNSAAAELLKVKEAGAAKAIGRKVAGFDQDIRDKERFDIVVRVNFCKFKNNDKLKEFPLNTGDKILVEASPVDKIWGIGLAEDDDRCQNPNEWRGLNLLGFALMVIRNQLRGNGT
ncbi:NADAR family protein [Microbulbifer sp. JMSA008]|uniref:NADAR family protein n=1 Tax=unclassified Microbulbifer TaxID=2619833 RepID=UPI00403AD814